MEEPVYVVSTKMIDEGKVHAKTEDPHKEVGKLEKDGDKAMNEENERRLRMQVKILEVYTRTCANRRPSVFYHVVSERKGSSNTTNHVQSSIKKILPLKKEAANEKDLRKEEMSNTRAPEIPTYVEEDSQKRKGSSNTTNHVQSSIKKILPLKKEAANEKDLRKEEMVRNTRAPEIPTYVEEDSQKRKGSSNTTNHVQSSIKKILPLKKEAANEKDLRKEEMVRNTRAPEIPTYVEEDSQKRKGSSNTTNHVQSSIKKILPLKKEAANEKDLRKEEMVRNTRAPEIPTYVEEDSQSRLPLKFW
ncbi:hypothetical protein Tco_0969115 [Tanacetum coccineum]